jgi:asparagine synthase (glutamine-hydrolysing)
MAWCFGLYAFLNCPASTAERVAGLAQMIAVSGQRIEDNMGYALSQRNNHGISEGMGLWTIGILFPEFRAAAKWREIGRRVLEQLGQELIYEDGSFVQHSVNYHRLMLHDYLWSLRLGDLHNSPFSTRLRDRVRRAGDWLYQIQDDVSGHAPRYGANDGALILPLNNCDYRDFRPTVQAAHYLCQGTRAYGKGPWDEDLLWLFGTPALEAPEAPSRRRPLQANAGGYYTLRSADSFVLTRCATFRHRPGHADMLHTDLWWKGQNVALDPGTHSYNAPEPWNGPLARTIYHNTVSVDGLDQMDRVGRFLWLPWMRGKARICPAAQGETPYYWEGVHDGYERLHVPVKHRRGILCLSDDSWLVVDAVTSPGEHAYRLHWLLADVPYQWTEANRHVRLEMPAGAYHLQVGTSATSSRYSLVRGDENDARGWYAPYYGHRAPAVSLTLQVQADCTVFWSLFGPEHCGLTASDNGLLIRANDWDSTVRWQVTDGAPLVELIERRQQERTRLVPD